MSIVKFAIGGAGYIKPSGMTLEAAERDVELAANKALETLSWLLNEISDPELDSPCNTFCALKVLPNATQDEEELAAGGEYLEASAEVAAMLESSLRGVCLDTEESSASFAVLPTKLLRVVYEMINHLDARDENLLRRLCRAALVPRINITVTQADVIGTKDGLQASVTKDFQLGGLQYTVTYTANGGRFPSDCVTFAQKGAQIPLQILTDEELHDDSTWHLLETEDGPFAIVTVKNQTVESFRYAAADQCHQAKEVLGRNLEKTTTFTADWVKSRDPDTLEDTEDSITWRAFHPNYSRYAFDTGHCHGVNWKQYDTDQDAWYFGVWVNLEERLVVTYAEGDITVRWIKTVDALRAELKRMAEFYGDPPPFAVSFGEEGRVEYYEERPKLED